jgi:hypothetical protein
MEKVDHDGRHNAWFGRGNDGSSTCGYMGHVHDDVEELLRWQVMIAQ